MRNLLEANNFLEVEFRVFRPWKYVEGSTP